MSAFRWVAHALVTAMALVPLAMLGVRFHPDDERFHRAQPTLALLFAVLTALSFAVSAALLLSPAPTPLPSTITVLLVQLSVAAVSVALPWLPSMRGAVWSGAYGLASIGVGAAAILSVVVLALVICVGE